MTKQHISTPKKHSRSPRNVSWLERKLNRIRNDRQLKKQLRHFLFIAAAMLIAFVLGFYFLGPSFSSD